MSRSGINFSTMVFLGTLLVSTAASGRTEGFCPFDQNFGSIKTVPFPKLYKWVDSIPKEKGDFEKTAIFDQKRQIALDHVSALLKAATGFDGIIVRKRVASARYDADREMVSVKTARDRYVSPIYDFTFLNFYTAEEADGLDAGRYTVDLGQYDAQNAFGRHALVTKQLSFEDFVSFGKGGHANTPVFQPLVRFQVPMSKAKQAMGTLVVAVAGRLLSPFTSRLENHSEAKIDYPYDVQSITKIIFIKPTCAVIRDSLTGKIYARAK